MDVNSCKTCGKMPALISNSQIEYDDVVSGVAVRRHVHDMPMSQFKCECKESVWHPSGDLTPMINEWNTANPKPDTSSETKELLKDWKPGDPYPFLSIDQLAITNG